MKTLHNEGANPGPSTSYNWDNSQSSAGSAKTSRSSNKTYSKKRKLKGAAAASAAAKRAKEQKQFHTSRKKLIFNDENATSGDFSQDDDDDDNDEDKESGTGGTDTNESEAYDELNYSSSSDSIVQRESAATNASSYAIARGENSAGGGSHSASRQARISTDSRPGTPFSLRKQIQLVRQLSSYPSPNFADKSASATTATPTTPGNSGSPQSASGGSGGGQSISVLPIRDSGETDSNLGDSARVSGNELVSSLKFLTQNKKGETELHFAAIRGELYELRYYLSNDHETQSPGRVSRPPSVANPTSNRIPVDVNVPDFAGWTPLHETCNRGNIQAARILLDHGANPNVAAFCGTTPIIDAVLNRQLSLIRLLIRKGADPFKKNKKGQNAFDLVKSAEEEECLLDYFRQNSLTVPEDLKFKYIAVPLELVSTTLVKLNEDRFEEVEDKKKRKQSPELRKETVQPKLIIAPIVDKSKIKVIISDSTNKPKTVEGETKSKLIFKLGEDNHRESIKEKNPDDKSEKQVLPAKIIIREDINSDKRDKSAVVSFGPKSNSARSDSIICGGDNNKSTPTSLKVKTAKSIGEQLRGKLDSSLKVKVVDPNYYANILAKNTPKDKQSYKQSVIVRFARHIMSNTNPTSSAPLSAQMAPQTSSSMSLITMISPSGNVITPPSGGDNTQKTATSGANTAVTNATPILPTTSIHPEPQLEKQLLLTPVKSNDDAREGQEGSSEFSNANHDPTSTSGTTSAPGTPGHTLRGRKRRRSADQPTGPKKPKDVNVGSSTGLEGGKPTTIKFKKNSLDEDELERESGGGGGEASTANLVTTVGAYHGEAGGNQPQRVPPIRIVLGGQPSSSTGGASGGHLTTSGGGGSAGAPTSNPNILVLNNPQTASNGGNLTSAAERPPISEGGGGNFASISAGKYPYVVNRSEHQHHQQQLDENEEATSPTSSTGGGTSTTSATTTSTTRITRSSQRVANQKNAYHHHGSDDDGMPSHSTRRKKYRGGGGNQQQMYSRSNSPLTMSMHQQHHDHDENSSSSTASGPLNSGPVQMGGGGGVSTLASCSASANGATGLTTNGANGLNGTNGTQSATSAASTNGQSAGTLGSSTYQYDPARNPYRMDQLIKDLTQKRRFKMKQVKPDTPPDFDQWLTCTQGYLLLGQPNEERPRLLQPPSLLKPRTSLYQLFGEQEQERQRLRLQHQVQRDRLRLNFEQETLRAYTRMAHANAKQLVPLSACTLLKDANTFNLAELDNDPKADNVIISAIREKEPNFFNTGPSGMTNCHGRYDPDNTHLVVSAWKDDLYEKWTKLKTTMLNTQRMESDALASRQKWRWQMKHCQNEYGPWSGNEANFDSMLVSDAYVPPVRVPQDFKLLPSDYLDY